MSMSDWHVLGLLRTVFGSILEVFLLCVAGYILARRGILDKKTQKQVNRLNVSLFTPSLLFSKVAFFLTPEKLRELWVIPIVFIVTTSVSMIVAYAFGWLLGLKKSQRSFAMAASMFMNSNSLPIALMQSLVYTVKDLHWGDDDSKNAMLGRALTYLVLYSTLGMMLRWSYGVHLLSQADEEQPDPAPVPGGSRRDATETTPLIAHDFVPPARYAPASSSKLPALVLTHSDESSSSLGSVSSNQPCTPSRLCADPVHKGDHPHPAGHEGAHKTTKYFYSFPNTPTYQRSAASSESELTDEEGRDLHSAHPPRSCRHRVWRRIRGFLHNVNVFMTVPMWAALASLLVACARPLQHALEVHLSPVKSALTAAGNCSIPLTLVVLGAYFYTPRPADENHGLAADGLACTLKNKGDQSLVGSVKKIFDLRRRSRRNSMPGQSAWATGGQVGEKRPGETKTVAVAVLSRMILTPVILLPLLALLIVCDAQQVFDDPVFVLSNVLLITSAPALTLAQITQAASGDAFERLISRTIFWAYCIVTPPLTIISVVVGLLLSRLR